MDCYEFNSNLEEGCYEFKSNLEEGCYEFTSSLKDPFVDEEEDIVTPPGEIAVPGDPTQKITCITRIGDDLFLVSENKLGIYAFESFLFSDAIEVIYPPYLEVSVSYITSTRLEVYDVRGSDVDPNDPDDPYDGSLSDMVAIFDNSAYKMHYFGTLLLDNKATVNTIQNSFPSAFMSQDTYRNQGSDSSYTETYGHNITTYDYYYTGEDKGCTVTPDCEDPETVCKDGVTHSPTTALDVTKERFITDGTIATCNLKSPYYDVVKTRSEGCWNEGKYAENPIQIYYVRDYCGFTIEDEGNYIFTNPMPAVFDVTSRWLINPFPKKYNMLYSANTGVTGGDSREVETTSYLSDFNYSREGNMMVSGGSNGRYSAHNGTICEYIDLPPGCKDFVIYKNSIYYVIGDNKVYWTPIIFSTT